MGASNGQRKTFLGPAQRCLPKAVLFGEPFGAVFQVLWGLLWYNNTPGGPVVGLLVPLSQGLCEISQDSTCRLVQGGRAEPTKGKIIDKCYFQKEHSSPAQPPAFGLGKFSKTLALESKGPRCPIYPLENSRTLK